MRNLAEDDAGIKLVFHELGSDVLLRNILNSLSSADGEVVLQAAYVLANLVNGTEAHQSTILSYPRLLTMLVRTCLTEGRSEIWRPAVACVLEFVRTNPKTRKDIIDAGFA